MPSALSYIRRSSYGPDDTVGLDVQREQCLGWYNLIKADYGGLQQGGNYEDIEVSASATNLFLRPEGRKLNEDLEHGDHVIFAKLDRAFRDVADFANTMVSFKRRDINVHFVDIRVDQSTPAGALVLNVTAAVSQWYSDLARIRRYETVIALRAQGRPTNGIAPYGYKIVGEKGRKRLIPDPDKRALGQAVVELRDFGMTWEEVSNRLEEKFAEAENREARPHPFNRFNRSTMTLWHNKELEFSGTDLSAIKNEA